MDNKIKRVDMLDYLRGLMAFSVLVYHYLVWSDVSLIYPFDQTISRLGLYAVSAFYVLSGASLAYVYSHKTVNKNFITDFSVKRIFRIAPLLWFATAGTIVLNSLASYMSEGVWNLPNISEIILNFTLTFGWLDHDAYIATGAWSIGNELVFYSFFPIMLFLIAKSKKSFAVFGILSILVSFYISEIAIDGASTLANEWSLYINPLNQLYLFVGGFLIGYLLRKGFKIPKNVLLPILIISVAAFVFMPFSGDDRLLYVTGLNKILFSLTVFGMTLFAAFWGNIKHNFATNTLKYFGDISYSVYLIHPLAYITINGALSVASVESKALTLSLSLVLTIIASHLVYNQIERPFIQIGRKVSKQLTINSEVESEKVKQA